MHAGALRALEFDRIVEVVSGLAVTPSGEQAGGAAPADDARAASSRCNGQRPRARGSCPITRVSAAGAVGSRRDPRRARRRGPRARAAAPVGTRRLSRVDRAVAAGDQEGRVGVSRSSASWSTRSRRSPSEIADVRRKIEPSGEVADNASPRWPRFATPAPQKQRLRSTLDSFLRGRETAKYLQEQVVTDRNGRHVLMVRAEHRSAIPGIVHGGSASGASLFVEPLETVEINNEIVALEEQEAEEVRRILLELTDAFRARPTSSNARSKSPPRSTSFRPARASRS